MSVMSSKTFLEFYVSKIDEYLEKKPQHVFGFCWWVHDTSRAEHSLLRDMWRLHDRTVYTDMAEILLVYCERHCIDKLEYLAARHGYNYERAHRLTEIRDGILLPRIKELA